MSDGLHTVGRRLRERAAAHPERIAVDDRGVRLDYAALCARAQRLADSLAEAGYGTGHRIVTVSGNSTDHVVAFFACAFLGATFVPLSWRLTPAELAELVRRTDPALVLIEDEHAALAGTALRMLEPALHPRAELGVAGVERAVPPPDAPLPRRAVRDDDPMLVIYTSGSEAAPKGVVLTHENCFWSSFALGQAMPITADDVVLAMLPQYHVAAWNVQPLLAWWSGATVVLERSFQPGRVLHLICERGVTAMMGVPTQYRMLMDAPEWTGTNLSSLRLAVVGGSTAATGIATAWAARGVPLTQGYGLTEAGPNALFLTADESLDRPGASGRPYPGVDARLVDPVSGLELEGAATGELQLRGGGVFTGYLDDPDATARAFDGDWLRTGDLVRRDDDGVHHVVDRLKEIFVSGGENVAPAEVEAALAAHPRVREVAVVGVPDEVWGERGVAFVVADGALSPDELLAFGRERLAAFKLPARVLRVDALPRSTIEKVARGRLRALAARLMKEDAHDGAH